jgi:hypothetical protein
MNASRRIFFRQFLGVLTLAGITACPYAIRLSAHTPLVSNAAHAQGNRSGGKGNGSGNGNGGNSGGKGQGRSGSGGGNTNSGRARSRGANPDAGIAHDNGMRETIQKGRYEMRDAQGRTIVNRPATAMDYLRLKVAR